MMGLVRSCDVVGIGSRGIGCTWPGICGECERVEA